MMKYITVLIFSALVVKADIAIVGRASATDNTASGSIGVTGFDTTGANAMFVAVEWGGSGTATVADTTNGAYTACTTGTASANGVLSTYYFQNAATSASLTVTATLDSSRSFRRIMVWALSGGHTTALIDAGCNAATGTTSPATTASLTPSSAGGIIIAPVSDNDGINCTFTANNSFTVAFGANGTLGGVTTFDTNAIEKLNSTGAQTPSVGLSAVGGDWRMVAVALKPATVSGGGSTAVRRRPVIQ